MICGRRRKTTTALIKFTIGTSAASWRVPATLSVLYNTDNRLILVLVLLLQQERIASSREGTKAKAEQLLSFVRKSVVGPQQSLYPFLRLVLPVNDVERGKIGLKQSSLARTYINALHLDKKTSTAAVLRRRRHLGR